LPYLSNRHFAPTQHFPPHCNGTLCAMTINSHISFRPTLCNSQLFTPAQHFALSCNGTLWAWKSFLHIGVMVVMLQHFHCFLATFFWTCTLW
jgi:hypothetical protein